MHMERNKGEQQGIDESQVPEHPGGSPSSQFGTREPQIL